MKSKEKGASSDKMKMLLGLRESGKEYFVLCKLKNIGFEILEHMSGTKRIRLVGEVVGRVKYFTKMPKNI